MTKIETTPASHFNCPGSPDAAADTRGTVDCRGSFACRPEQAHIGKKEASARRIRADARSLAFGFTGPPSISFRVPSSALKRYSPHGRSRRLIRERRSRRRGWRRGRHQARGHVGGGSSPPVSIAEPKKGPAAPAQPDPFSVTLQQIRKTGKAGSRRGTSSEPRSAPNLNSGQSRGLTRPPASPGSQSNQRPFG
jgi:hypothetical protein